MSKGIRVSKEFGVNPSVTRCECCGKEYGIALFGTGIKDRKTGKTVEAPPYVFQGLYNDCQGVIDQGGVMIIEVKDGETGNNPYRTGRLVGCSKQFKEGNHIESPIVYMEEKLFSQLFNEALKGNEINSTSERND